MMTFRANNAVSTGQRAGRIVFPKDNSGKKQSSPIVPNSGYAIDPASQAVAGQSNQTSSFGVRPSVLLIVFGALFLFLVSSLTSSNKTDSLRSEIPQVLKDYGNYLKNNNNADQVSTRLEEVKQALERAAFFYESGDKKNAQTDLANLMLLDSDTRSPLYKYCVKLSQKK
jgi:hypothetical protein